MLVSTHIRLVSTHIVLHCNMRQAGRQAGRRAGGLAGWSTAKVDRHQVDRHQVDRPGRLAFLYVVALQFGISTCQCARANSQIVTNSHFCHRFKSLPERWERQPPCTALYISYSIYNLYNP